MNTNPPFNRLSWTRAALAALSLSGLCLAAGPGSDDAAGLTTYAGITAPSEKRDQAFDVPGVVQKVMVKEGDAVKTGDLLAQQNIEGDKAHLDSLDLQAKSAKLEVDAAKLQLEKDKVDLKRKQQMLKDHAISPGEVDEAKLQVDIDGLKGDSAAFSHSKALADMAEESARIEQKKLYSKIDGVISKINTRDGELASNDIQHPTMTIVKNNPLYVEVVLPAPLVTKLKADALKTMLQVQYMDEPGGKWRDAKIQFIRPEADRESNSEFVRLEMPNPEGRSSGLSVMVRMPVGAPVGAAASSR